MRSAFGAPVLQSQAQKIPRSQLEIGHGLCRDEDTVRPGAQRLHQCGRRPAGEPRVLKLPGVADRAGTHAVEVLQVRADIGEAVLQRLDAGHPGDLRQPVGVARPDARAGRLRDGHIGAVGQPRVDLRLLPVGGVEDRGGARERDGQRRQRDGAREQAALTAHRGRDDRGERAGERSQRPCQRPAATPQQSVGAAERQEPGADPDQDRGQQRVPVDRDLRHALRREHEVVAPLGGLPEHESAEDERDDIEAGALPPRRPDGPTHALSLTGNGEQARVAPGGKRDRPGGDQQARERRAEGPQRGRRRACAEACGAEAGGADRQRAGETRGDAEGAREPGLGERQVHQLARRGSASPQQRTVTAPAPGARRRDRGGHEAGEDRPGKAEEQEQELGVQRILACLVERGAEVVADAPAAGEPRLEVQRAAVDRLCRPRSGCPAVRSGRGRRGPGSWRRAARARRRWRVAAGRRCPAGPRPARRVAAPTVWNSESAVGRSTTPSTRTRAGAPPTRPIEIVSPGAAWRFAAVCWASSTPVAAARRACARVPGNAARVAVGQPEHLARAGALRRPAGVALEPGRRRRKPTRQRLRGRRGAAAPRPRRRAASRPAGPRPASRRPRAPRPRRSSSSSCDERKAPIDASSATHDRDAQRRSRASRARRWATRPPSQVQRDHAAASAVSRPLAICQRVASGRRRPGRGCTTTSAASAWSAAASRTSTTSSADA